jgi:hypothetical protein
MATLGRSNFRPFKINDLTWASPTSSVGEPIVEKNLARGLKILDQSG